jgi:membrane peptidoglycan carboxypeptidase
MMRRGRYAGLFAAGLLVYLSVLPIELGAVRFSRTQVTGIDIQTVHVALKDAMVQAHFPETFGISGRDRDQQTDVMAQYTIRPDLQTHLDETFTNATEPDYAAFFAMNADTGAVIAYADYVRNHEDNIYGHLALHALFPAASVFKMITAAAVLDHRCRPPRIRSALQRQIHQPVQEAGAEAHRSQVDPSPDARQGVRVVGEHRIRPAGGVSAGRRRAE